MPIRLLNKLNFSLEVEKLVEDNQTTYIDAIVDASTRNDIPIETASKFLSDSILRKLRVEALELNFYKKNKKLKIKKQLKMSRGKRASTAKIQREQRAAKGATTRKKKEATSGE